MQMILKGQKPVYIREAIFYDEPTDQFKPMLRQRFRWGMGSVQTMRLMTGKLFRYALHVNHKIFDAFWFLAQIPFFFISGLLSITKMLVFLPVYRENPAWFIRDSIIPVVAYLGTILTLILLIKLEQKDLKIYFKGILAYPILGAIWADLVSPGVLRPPEGFRSPVDLPLLEDLPRRCPLFPVRGEVSETPSLRPAAFGFAPSDGASLGAVSTLADALSRLPIRSDMFERRFRGFLLRFDRLLPIRASKRVILSPSSRSLPL